MSFELVFKLTTNKRQFVGGELFRIGVPYSKDHGDLSIS
nr:MAG TPA: hypothetical protein [Bacteriophage sp.]